MTPYAHPHPSAPSATFTPLDDEPARLAAALMAAVLPPGGPRRVALMNGPDRERKYSDPPKGHRFTVEDMRAHLRTPGQPGARTWAATLINAEGLAVAGCRDYDGDNGLGAAQALQALDAAGAAGLSAFAILVDGRGHVWPLYRRPAPGVDIAAQIAAVMPAGKGEIYPSGNNIRLPLGYHRRALTRGTLVLQDGRRFELDRPADRVEGLRAILSLRRNAPPPPAPAGQASAKSSGAGAATYDPALWADLPDGAALMGSARYRALFTKRPQLAALAAGRRILITTNTGPDDAGDKQVSVLVSNLLTTGPAGAPGRGAPPEDEIRAIALYWRETLRPPSPSHPKGYPLASYMADVDRLIAKYTPATYAPEATRSLGQAAPPPAPLAPPRGRPAGQRAEQAERLAELLAQRVGQVVTSAGLAAELDVKPRMLALYLADLRAAGRLDTARAGRGLRILRSAIKSPPPVEQPAELVAEGPPVEAPPICNRSEAPEAAQRIGAAQTADEAVCDRTHRPPQPPCPAAGAALDLVALAAELVENYGAAWARAKVAARKSYGIGGRGDGERLAALRAAYDAAAGAQRAAQKRQTAQRAEDRKRAEWAAKRAAAGALDDVSLLAAVKAWAGRLEKAEQKRPGGGYAKMCAAELGILDDERRRRRLALDGGQAPAPARTRAERREGTARIVKAAATIAGVNRRAAEALAPAGAPRLELGSIWDDYADTPPAAEQPPSAGCVLPARKPAPSAPGPWLPDTYDAGGLAERLRRLARPVSCAD